MAKQKNFKLQIQEAKKTSKRTDTKKSMPRYIKIKLLKIKDKKKIFKGDKKKNNTLLIKKIPTLYLKLQRPEKKVTHFSNAGRKDFNCEFYIW